MTSPISGTSGAHSAPQAQGASSTLDKDAFMKLLVAQLKYQNPMQPTDGNEYMSQMAVFAQVEKLTSLLSSQQASETWQQRTAAQGLVGRLVTGTDADAATRTGTVTSVSFDGTTPRLTLSDGTTLDLGDVTTVEQAP